MTELHEFDDDIASALAAASAGEGGPFFGIRQAVVQSVSGTAVTLRIGATTVDVTGVRSFVPVVAGQTVWLLIDGRRPILLDALDTGWLALPLANGWVQYDGFWAPPQYRRIGGVVHVQGLIKNGNTGGSVAFANLPVGFRPAANLHIVTVTNAAFGYFHVRTDGAMTNGTVQSTWLAINVTFAVGG